MVEYRNIPYLATTNLAKIIDWFDEKDIVYLQAERRIMSATAKEKPLPYVSVWNTVIKGFYLRFTSKHGRIYGKEIKKALDKYSDGSAVVVSLVQYAKNPQKRLREEIAADLQDSRLKTGVDAVYFLWEATLIGKGENSDSKFIRDLSELNKEELEKKHFKLSTLDCVEIKTRHQWLTHDGGYDPRKYQTGKLSEEILQNVDAGKEWKSNRGYMAVKEKGWKLVSW